MKTVKHRSPLYLASVIVLLLGLGSALVIYMRAGNDPNSVLGYYSEGGYVYTVAPEDSKMYRHDLELYGGKANVLADDFRRWFEGLWQGKSLAFMVGGCSIIISLIFLTAARRLPSDVKSDATGTGKGGSSTNS